MKLEIRYHFYKPAIDGHLLDDGINIHTYLLALATFRWDDLKYNYSHVEVEFVDRGLCFSSTLRDDAKGVRFALSSDVLKHPDRWDTIRTWVSLDVEQSLYATAKREIGKKYDKLGLFTGFFLLAPYLQSYKERYCSDLAAWLAWKQGILRWRYWIVSPRRQAGLMVRTPLAELGRPVPLTSIIKV